MKSKKKDSAIAIVKALAKLPLWRTSAGITYLAVDSEKLDRISLRARRQSKKTSGRKQ